MRKLGDGFTSKLKQSSHISNVVGHSNQGQSNRTNNTIVPRNNFNDDIEYYIMISQRLVQDMLQGLQRYADSISLIELYRVKKQARELCSSEVKSELVSSNTDQQQENDVEVQTTVKQSRSNLQKEYKQKNNSQEKDKKIKLNFQKRLMLSKHKSGVVELQSQIKRKNNKQPLKNQERQRIAAASSAGKQKTSQKHNQNNPILYCVCQEPYDQEYPMLECEKCNQWFHFNCIGYVGGIKKAKYFRFICTACLKVQNKASQKKTIRTYLDLFKKKSSMYFDHKDIFMSLETDNTIIEEQKCLRNENDQRKSRSRNRK